jgi:hypothetical protein
MQDNHRPGCFKRCFWDRTLSPPSGKRSIMLSQATELADLRISIFMKLEASSEIMFIMLIIIQDSVVGIVTSYGLDDQEVGVRIPIGSRMFSSPYRPDRLWGPPNLLSNGYGGLFPGGKAAGE